MATPLNSTVLKAFDALDLLGPERTEITARIAAVELGMNYATAHRFLTTLEAAGVLVATRRGAYGLGPRLARLGRMADELGPLSARVHAVLDDIRKDLNESVMACRLSSRGPRCVAVLPADRPLSVNIKTGTILPMSKTAQGKLWLAFMSSPERAAWINNQHYTPGEIAALEDELTAIFEAGYARNLGDNEPDIGALAVPVLAHDGQPLMTLSVFGMLSRFDKTLLARAEEKLKSAARDLEGLKTNF